MLSGDGMPGRRGGGEGGREGGGGEGEEGRGGEHGLPPPGAHRIDINQIINQILQARGTNAEG